MQYKQARRILTEVILMNKDLAVKLQLRLIDMLLKNDLPKLGPFQKRSPAQILWWISSDASRQAVERWAALEKLLEEVESCVRQVESPSARPQTGQAA